MCNGPYKVSNILKLTFILFLLFSCKANKTLPTVSHNMIQSSKKLLEIDDKNYGNLSILLYKEANIDYTICINNQYIGIIGPQTKANLMLSEGTHNIILGIRATIDGMLNYESNPCGPRRLMPYNYINRNLNVTSGKNYVFDIQLDKSGWNIGKGRYRVYFNEISKDNQRLSMFRPVVSYVDPRIQMQKEPINISKPKKIMDDQINLSTAKKECTDLGFKEKSEKFGECVMELIK